LVSKATGLPVLVLAAPIKDAGGAIKGVMAGVVDLGEFTGLVMNRIKIGKTGYAYMLTKDGKVAAHPDKKLILKLNLRDHDFGREMLSKKGGIITYDGGDGLHDPAERGQRPAGRRSHVRNQGQCRPTNPWASSKAMER
jgi:hypothetical protein